MTAPLTVNGWTILVHPLFLDQVAALVAAVRAAKARDPRGYTRRNSAKRLAAILKLGFEVIPQDPANPAYRQGDTLGPAHRHWFRAKFFQQYRLFFRFDSAARIIILAWVNDEDTKRAYGRADDAYAVFRAMLRGGNPPDSWAALKQAATSGAALLAAARDELP